MLFDTGTPEALKRLFPALQKKEFPISGSSNPQQTEENHEIPGIDKLYRDPKLHPEILEAYRSAGIEYEEDGVLILHYAASHADVEAIELLPEAGADANGKNRYEETPLIVAAMQGQNDFTAMLLEASAEVNPADNEQHTALYYASERGFTEIVEQLVTAGAEG